MFRHSSKSLLSFILTAGVGLALLGSGAHAQAPSMPAPAAPGPNQPAPAQTFSPQQLDDLVAPIALYPDALVSQVLVAATYPLEIVEAAQWLQQNGNLRGQQLVDAARLGRNLFLSWSSLGKAVERIGRSWKPTLS